MKWRIEYMVDPGDGIISKAVVETETDLITEAIDRFWDPGDDGSIHDPYFIIKVEWLMEEDD